MFEVSGITGRVSGWLAGVVLVLALGLCAQADARESRQPSPAGNGEPVYIEANSMQYDQNSRTVTATGRVEIVQGKRIVVADQVSYHEPSSTVRARGNVSVLEPDGNVYFADAIELKDGLKRGVIEQLRAQLSDGSRFAAARGEKVSDSVMKLDRAVYSPCKLCRDDETGEEEAPLWQLKARSITQDDEAQKITYRDARMELFGVPVAYTPYLSHPTPDAESKSGFLAPSYKLSSQLGTMISLPYFISLAPNMDATITPTTASDESPILVGEFRHLTPLGKYEFKGSITNPERRNNLGQPTSGRELRGHIEGSGKFNLDETWGAGFTGRYASDDTYLRRYQINNAPVLVSNAWLEGIGSGRNDLSYARAELLAFQNFRSDSVDELVPIVHPLIQGEHSMQLGWWDSMLKLSGNMMSLTRQEGNDTHRISGTAAWQKQAISDVGLRVDMKASLRADGYVAPNMTVNGQVDDEANLRAIPKASVSMRYPVVASSGLGNSIIEPIVEAIATPSGLNPDDIPNEDSLTSDFSDTTLFTDERSPGVDRVESGSRINYGMRVASNFGNSTDVEALFGQSYLFDPDPFYYYNTGLDEHWSDYAGRISLRHGIANISYRFRLDQNDFQLKRNEILADFAWNGLTAQVGYYQFLDDLTFADSDEIIGQAGWKFAENWQLRGSAYRDLSDSRWISNALGLAYQNECITLLGQVSRAYSQDRDILPSTSYMLQVFFKNLN